MDKIVDLELPKEVEDALNGAAKKYSESKATTNAGVALRFLARFIKVSTVLKLFAHKVNK